MPKSVLPAHPYSDSFVRVKDDVDPTKQLRDEVGAISTGTTRVITWPDSDLNFTAGSGTFVARAGDTMTGLLQFSGTTHTGLRLISLTTVERDALTPVNGDLLYNETDNKLQARENGSYKDLITGGGGLVDLTSQVTGILPGANGGTDNGFMDFAGPTTSLKTFTLPDATSAILTDNALVTGAQGGTANAFFEVTGPAAATKTFTFPNASATVLTDNAVVTGAQGGTNNVFMDFTGPTTSLKTFTLPDASAVILTDNADVTVAQGGTGSGTAGGARTNLGAANIAGDTFTGLIQFSGTGHFGILLNSLTTAQRDGIGSPVNGNLFFNSTDGKLQAREGGAFKDIITAVGGTIDLTSQVTGILPGSNGGSNNAFWDVTGPTTSIKTFTFPDASAVVLTDNTDVTVAQGGTGSGTAAGARANLGAVNIAGDTMTGKLQFSGTGHVGLRMNNLTTVQRDATSATAGDHIWNTTTVRAEVFDGSSWVATGGAGGTPTLIEDANQNTQVDVERTADIDIGFLVSEGIDVAAFQAPAGANAQFLLANGTAALPSLGFIANPGSGMSNSSGDLKFSVGGTEKLSLAAGQAQLNDIELNGVKSMHVGSTTSAATDAITIQVTASVDTATNAASIRAADTDGAGTAGIILTSEEGGNITFGGDIGTVHNFHGDESIADEGSLTTDIPGGTRGGIGMVRAGDGVATAFFSFKSNGDVEIHSFTGSVLNTDTNENLCLFANGAGDGVEVKNRLGATHNLHVTVWRT